MVPACTRQTNGFGQVPDAGLPTVPFTTTSAGVPLPSRAVHAPTIRLTFSVTLNHAAQ